VIADADGLPRVLVVDHPVTRLGVRLALDGGAVVCGEAEDVVDAVGIARREQPDVCLVGMGVADGGVEAVGRLREAFPGVAVVAMAHEPDPEELLAAVRAGAIGYIPACIERSALRRVIRAARDGEAAVPRTLVLELMQELRAAAGDGRHDLTARQVQILGMLRVGSSTAQIAERLRISPITVRRHVSALVRKTGVENREALVQYEHGSIPA